MSENNAVYNLDDYEPGDFEVPGPEWIKSVDSAEEYQSQTLNVSWNSGTAAVVLRCKWEDRFNAIVNALEGGPDASPSTFPYESAIRGGDTGAPWVATAVSIVPAPSKYSKSGEAIEYEYALVTVTYSQVTTEVSFDSTGTFMTINPLGIYWKLNGTPTQIAPEEAPGLFIPSHDLTLSHPHMRIVKNMNGQTFNLTDYEGTCNESEVTLQTNGFSRTYPAETLCCSSPSLKCGCNLCGSGFFAVTLKIAYNPLTHNKWYHPKQEVPQGAVNSIYNRTVEMYSDGECTTRFKPVKTMDFKPLFQAFGLDGTVTPYQDPPLE